jgi:hypothetical protein
MDHRPGKSLVSALPLLLVACGGDPGKEPEVEPPADEALDPATCSSGWRVVFSPEDKERLPAEDLAWHDQRLYFRLPFGLKEGVQSVPANGGQASRHFDGWAWRFWIEDDRLVYVGVEGELFSQPLAGGPAAKVFANPRSSTRQGAGIKGWALDRDSVYWTRVDMIDGENKASLWRGDRAAQTATMVGLVPTRKRGSALIDDLLLVGDRLVALNMFGDAWTVPRAGGEVQVLSVADSSRSPRFVGVSDDGFVLLTHFQQGAPGTKDPGSYAVTRRRLDGGEPQPFWTAKPKLAYPLQAWGDGKTGWYVAAWESEKDRDVGPHLTIWSLDAEGRGTRLACDPEVVSRVASAVVTPDGLFAVVDQSNDYWQIVTVGNRR